MTGFAIDPSYPQNQALAIYSAKTEAVPVYCGLLSTTHAFQTVRSFLSTNAIRAEDSMDKIDWCSSNNSTPCAVQQISVPILIAPMGGYYFVRDNEIHYELAKSEDKEFIVIEGAVHSQRPCTACETTPGQYSNTVKHFYNHARDWMNARFRSN